MERLTFFEGGHWRIRLNETVYSGFPEIVRLAAYEDTGLEPKEIEERLEAYKELFFERADLYNAIGSIEHIRDLAQAEKDGRLVVLPDAKYTDPDGEEAIRKAMWTCGNTNNPVTRYAADAIAEKLCRDAEKGKPLTLEQLRKMDGEPVFVTSSIGEQPMWYIVDVEENELKNPWDRITLEEWDEGYPYKAYRRKPEEIKALIPPPNAPPP